jgi:hypothetical protein
MARLAQVMLDSFVYLELLLDGESREDRGIWMAALEASRDVLARHPEAPAVMPAITRARAQVASSLARAQTGERTLRSLTARALSAGPTSTAVC